MATRSAASRIKSIDDELKASKNSVDRITGVAQQNAKQRPRTQAQAKAVAAQPRQAPAAARSAVNKLTTNAATGQQSLPASTKSAGFKPASGLTVNSKTGQATASAKTKFPASGVARGAGNTGPQIGSDRLMKRALADRAAQTGRTINLTNGRSATRVSTAGIEVGSGNRTNVTVSTPKPVARAAPAAARGFGVSSTSKAIGSVANKLTGVVGMALTAVSAGSALADYNSNKANDIRASNAGKKIVTGLDEVKERRGTVSVGSVTPVTFGQAFKEARKANGNKDGGLFSYNGKSYTTNTKRK